MLYCVFADRYVLFGNHRDAWGYGAVDPSTGTANILESARILGEVMKTGNAYIYLHMEIIPPEINKVEIFHCLGFFAQITLRILHFAAHLGCGPCGPRPLSPAHTLHSILPTTPFIYEH